MGFSPISFKSSTTDLTSVSFVGTGSEKGGEGVVSGRQEMTVIVQEPYGSEFVREWPSTLPTSQRTA